MIPPVVAPPGTMPPLEPLKPLEQSVDMESKARDASADISQEFQLDYSQSTQNGQVSAESAKKWLEALDRAKSVVENSTSAALNTSGELNANGPVKVAKSNKQVVEAIELFKNAASTAAQLSLSVSVPQGMNSSLKRLQQGQ